MDDLSPPSIVDLKERIVLYFDLVTSIVFDFSFKFKENCFFGRVILAGSCLIYSDKA